MSDTKCKECGRFLEPTDEAMETLICGYCSGRISKTTRECYDGSPCTKPDQDCNTCEWLRGDL